MAVIAENVDFTNENFNKLFPNKRVMTPIGEVKIGENQYKKLETREDGERQKLLGVMFQTLSDPVVVVKQKREKDKGRASLIFSKSFLKDDVGHYKVIISVVVDQEENGKPIKVAISTHQRNSNEVLKTIKNPADIAYEKPISEGGDSGDHDVISPSPDGRHSTPPLSHTSGEKSSNFF